MNGPRIVCVACGEVEVGIYTPICCDCERAMEQEWDQAREQEMREYERREHLRIDAIGGKAGG